MTHDAAIPDYQLDEAQRAARDLLVHGIVTPRHPDLATFARVRKWAAWLTAELDRIAGWPLRDTRAAVRLERRCDNLDSNGWWPDEDRVPDARLLALTCLVLAALEQADDQLLLSDLASLVRAAATRSGVPFDAEVHADRRAFCHAVGALEVAGAITIRDGHLEAWRDRSGEGEALLDVDRDVRQLVFVPAKPIHAVNCAQELLQTDTLSGGRDATRIRRRQRVSRMLLDRPVVYFVDLDEADRTYLRLEASSIASEIERLTGGIVERRAEGVALVMPHGAFGAETFPSADGVTVAALALATDISDAYRAPASTEAVSRPSCSPAPPVRRGVASPPPCEAERAAMVPDDLLLRAARVQLTRLGDAVRRDLREPEAFARAAVQRLATFDLVRPVPGGVCPMPALERFREATLRPPTRRDP